jgi:hypothetical protein
MKTLSVLLPTKRVLEQQYEILNHIEAELNIPKCLIPLIEQYSEFYLTFHTAISRDQLCVCWWDYVFEIIVPRNQTQSLVAFSARHFPGHQLKIPTDATTLILDFSYVRCRLVIDASIIKPIQNRVQFARYEILSGLCEYQWENSHVDIGGKNFVIKHAQASPTNAIWRNWELDLKSMLGFSKRWCYDYDRYYGVAFRLLQYKIRSYQAIADPKRLILMLYHDVRGTSMIDDTILK